MSSSIDLTAPSLRRRKRSLKRFRAIILYRVYAYFVSDKEKTHVGFFWFFLDPLLYAATFLLMSAFLRHREEEFTAFVIIGSITWQFISTTISNMAGSIEKSRNVIQQIYLPKILFPLTELCIAVLEYLFSLVLLILGLMAFGYLPGYSLVLLPVLLLIQFVFCLGVGLPLAAVTPFAPDIKEVVRSLMRLLGFLSGIFFTAAKLGGTTKLLFYINPVSHILDIFRAVLLYKSWPSWISMLYPLCFGLIAGCLGFWLIFKYDRHYVKALSK
jgi:ABC-type polysaccharide/polyol phosphate export permease